MTYDDATLALLSADAKEILARYPVERSGLLPLLHLVQSVDGFVSPDGIAFCAEQVNLTVAEVSAVATFYTQYKRRPNGEFQVGVCTNTLCAVMGGDRIWDELSEHVGVRNGETTRDGKVTLERIECNAACDYAPVMMVNWEFFDNQTPESAKQVVDDILAGKPVTPSRGPNQVASFKQVERVLAGFEDGLANEDQGSGAPTLAGLEAAKAAGWAASGTEGWPVMTELVPVLSAIWDQDRSWTLDTYAKSGGYGALKKALAMAPTDIIQAVKDSGLRGRGGAGFPTGMKWGFLPPDDGLPRYLVVNADESEPGTCKDIPTMLENPHVLVEGVAITSFAIGCNHAFIYVRGEVVHVYRRLLQAVREAYEAGHLGQNIHGTGYNLDVTVHAGAGAYICGEETALLDSLEGRRGQPRLKPPFPAVAGLYARPTVVNNVESIASVPAIIDNGVDWFTGLGTDKSKGMGFFSLSGHVTTPGQYEAPLGITLRELLEHAGGIREGHELKFWTPGGSSTPIFTPDHLDTPLDYESVGAAGSMLGTRALQLFDETTCVVRAVMRWTEFYKHESCGKCTPCREGTYWLALILKRIEHGEGTMADIQQLLDTCDSIAGRAFCALGDGATSSIISSVKLFREEYEAHVTGAGCPFDHAASALFPFVDNAAVLDDEAVNA